jgi:hypothetical protein
MEVHLNNFALRAFKETMSFANDGIRATIGKSSGKWYWEFTLGAEADQSGLVLGIVDGGASMATYPGGSAFGAGLQHGNTFNGLLNGVTGSFGGAVTFGANDVWSFAFDAGAGEMRLSRNGTPVNGGAAIWSGLTGVSWYAAASFFYTTAARGVTANFGQSAFAFAVPGGYSSGIF